VRVIISYTAAAGVALLSGCSAFQDSWYRDYGVQPLSIDDKSPAVVLRKALVKNGSEGIVDASCFDAPLAASTNATSCQQQRNSAIAVLLTASDDLCQAHLKTIFGNDAAFNIATGSIATLFSGAAAISGSASAKSALAAISTFSNAERSLVNETVYKNMIVTAVTKKIREARATKVAAILPSDLTKSMSDYPMVLAIRDVLDYHYSCSFMFGLEKALEEGTQSGIDGKKAKLEQERNALQLYLDTRAANKSLDQTGVAGAQARMKEIDAQLTTLDKASAAVPSSTTPSPAAGAGQGSK